MRSERVFFATGNTVNKESRRSTPDQVDKTGVISKQHTPAAVSCLSCHIIVCAVQIPFFTA